MTNKNYGRVTGGRIMEAYYDYPHLTNLVYEALDYGMESIQVFPNQVRRAKELLDGRPDAPAVCAVIAYPHGTFLPEQTVCFADMAFDSPYGDVFHSCNFRRPHSFYLIHYEYFPAFFREMFQCEINTLLQFAFYKIIPAVRGFFTESSVFLHFPVGDFPVFYDIEASVSHGGEEI